MYLWAWTGQAWSNGHLGSSPSVGSGPITIAPKPRKGHLHVRIVMTWHWAKSVTRLIKLRWIDLPKRATVRVRCRDRGCPARAWSGRPGRRKGLRTFTGARFHPGDTITITISQRGRVPERAQIVIRANRIPKTRLL
jgi:hypothetical protein